MHEGGIATPLIAYWPAGIKQQDHITHQPGHIIDLMATCCDLAGVGYPETYQGKEIIPLEGRSLAPIFQGEKREGHEVLYWEHMGNRAIRRGRWKLVSVKEGRWELYDLEADRTELRNLTRQQPELARELAALYEELARRCGV